MFGGWDSLGAAIQSSALFAYAPVICTGMGYLGLQIAVQAAAAFAAGLFLWGLFLLADSPVFAGIIVSGILCCEYAAYRFIPGTSSVGVLKYANIYQMMTPMESIVDYANCRFFVLIVSRSALLWGVLVALAMTGAALAVIISEKKYSAQRFIKIKKRAALFVRGYYAAVARLPVIMLEGYKILVLQRGFLVILLLGVLMVQVPVNGGVAFDDTKNLLRDYYRDAGGNLPGQEADRRIKEYEQKLADKQEKYNTVQNAVNAGEHVNVSERDNLADEIKILSAALQDMHHQLAYLSELKEERGVDAQIIMPFTYEYLLGGRMDYSMNLINLYVILAVIFLAGASLSYENRGGMKKQIRSGINGRSAFICRKLFVNELIVLLVGGTVYGYYFWRLSQAFTFNDLGCSVLSIESMHNIPVNMSIRAYLIFSFLLKLLLITAVMLIVTAVSLQVDFRYTAIASMILLLPHMLYLLGFEVFRYFSVVLPLDNWQMERFYGGSIWMYIIYGGLLLLGALCGRYTVKAWG